MRAMSIGWPLFTQADPLTGFSLRPYAEGWNVDEQRAYVKINSDGWRDDEYGEKTQKRIAVIGDSFTEARQVDIDDTFWNKIDCAEVMNFGVSGFGTTQEYLILRDRVLAYEPDIVVLAFFPGNDVSNNSRALENGMVPYFENGDFQFDFQESEFYISQNKLYNKLLMAGVNHSRVLQLFNRLRKINLVKEKEGQVLQKHTAEDPFREPSTLEWTRAWDTTESLISMMNGISPEFLLMMISSWEQVHPDALYREGLDTWYPNTRIKKLADTEGFTFIDPVPLMNKKAVDEGVYFHGFNKTLGQGHWNEKGHAIAGELLAKTICNN